MASLFERIKDNWLKINFYVVIAGLIFSYGVAVGLFNIFPYSQLQTIARVSLDMVRNPRHNLGIRPEKFLKPPRQGSSETINATAASAYPGVTFVTGFFAQSTGMKLFDMDGEVIHEWRVPFSEIWPTADHVPMRIGDWDTQIHGAVLFPNGDVVFNFQYAGLAKIDRCSQVIWRLPEQAHHSVHVDADGNLWLPSRIIREERVADYPYLPPPFQDDYIVKVSPDGKLLQEISVLKAIGNSEYEGVLFANGAHKSQVQMPLDRDFVHINDVEVLSADIADAFPMFQAGDMLVSLRNLNLLLVLDAAGETVKWSMIGPFLRQHDPDFLANGHISVFDNRRDGSGEVLGGSRILEIDPLSRQVRVIFQGTKEHPFYTDTMGDHQPLPNGNVLITESESGYAFEVSEQGQIVWSFVNWWDEESVAQIGRATRYPGEFANSVTAGSCN